MATKRYLEIQSLDSATIADEVKQASADLTRMYFEHGSRGLENPQVLSSSRKDIARLNTELRAREIKEMSSEDLSKRSKIRLRRKNN